MYWGIDPATNAFRLMSGAGPAAHAAQLAAYEAAAITHTEQGAQSATTAAATAPSFVGLGGIASAEQALEQAAWMQGAAAHAHTAAGLIAAGQVHYITAVANTIPAPVVVANRVREATLQATNFMGFNTIAIAESNAEYAFFWGKNAGAMMTYLAGVSSLLGPLSVPLVPLTDMANPAAVGGAVASAAGEAAEVGMQAMSAGLSQAAAGATEAASTGAGMAAETAQAAAQASASSGSPSQAGTPVSAGPGAATAPGNGQPGSRDAMQSVQSLIEPMTQAPQMAASVAGSPLSSAGQLPSMLGGQVGGLMGPLSQLTSGMNGGSGGAGGFGAAPPLSAASAPWSGLGAANGGFAGGGSAVSAALTKPSSGAVGMGGPVGLGPRLLLLRRTAN